LSAWTGSWQYNQPLPQVISSKSGLSGPTYRLKGEASKISFALSIRMCWKLCLSEVGTGIIDVGIVVIGSNELVNSA
jgi:hypothetical protein